jgi:hypothetical protein
VGSAPDARRIVRREVQSGLVSETMADGSINLAVDIVFGCGTK